MSNIFTALSEDILVDATDLLEKEKGTCTKSLSKWENGNWYAENNSVCTKQPYYKDSPVVVLCDNNETARRIACLFNMEKVTDASH
tara:strand:+ start:831 stop:1088 length:258 start_codon:yes stop_codon:yes gene_type:complete